MPKAGSALTSNFTLSSIPPSATELSELSRQSHEDSGAYRTYVSADMASLYAPGYTSLFLRDKSGKIAGGMVYKVESDKVHVYDIGVLKQYRGRGLGRLLMKQAAKTAAARKVGIELTEVADAAEFYDRLGLSGSGVRRLTPAQAARLANS